MMIHILSSKDQLKCLDRSGLRQAVRTALEKSAARQTSRLPRTVLDHAAHAKLGFMPAFAHEDGIFGYKTVAVTAGNRERGLNPHQGLVCLFDGESGRVRALLEGSTLTALRTAAASAAATDALARPDATVMAIIGSGLQAREHLFALLEVRAIREIRLAGRSPESVERLRAHVAPLLPRGTRLKVTASPQEAVTGAHVVTTCTASRHSFLKLTDFDPGAHINAIGASRPGSSELSLHNRPDLRVFVDSEVSCAEEASELASGIRVAGEIGEVFAGRKTGREHADQITLFKAVGTGVTDVFAADELVRRAQAASVGARLEFA